MPLVIRRPVVFMCQFCGFLFLDDKQALQCESNGISLPVCGEGDILEVWGVVEGWIRGDTARSLGRDNKFFTGNRYKVIGVLFDRVAGWLKPDGLRSHGLPITFKCQKTDGTKLDILYPQSIITKAPPKKVFDWKEYFKELEERNPSVRDDTGFRKYGSEDKITKALYGRAIISATDCV
ncbi:MAG: hypothetical protein Q7S19_00345 [bacterium]|nr:hypothetical protein [bacterium]